MWAGRGGGGGVSECKREGEREGLLEGVVVRLAGVVYDDVVPTVCLVDVDLSLNCKMSSFNERCAERFSAERVRTFSAM